MISQQSLPTTPVPFTSAKDRKRKEKKREIAISALETLNGKGYAQTRLRDIAARADMSLGMVHYYFDSKEDLMIYCVRRYKSSFFDAMDTILQSANTPEDLRSGICEALLHTVETEAAGHRLWYDIRSQAMFDPTFQPVVVEMETMMMNMIAPFSGNPSDRRVVAGLYARIDGVFRLVLQDHLEGNHFNREERLRLFEDALPSEW
ncbi:MAG: TetR family transcriptional regulator [Rhodobacteraceae bacterium]|nr:TetR family transcriptional regulator [Paracoccaceae bacterium]